MEHGGDGPHEDHADGPKRAPPKKHELQALAIAVDAFSSKDFQKTLDHIVGHITFHLRDHVFKENTMLYPTALGVIAQEDS